MGSIMKRASFLVVVILLGEGDLYAQAPDTLWTKTYGGINDDIGLSVEQTSDEGFIITGWTYSFGAGGSDAFLIKTDAEGDILWYKTYGGPADDNGFSVQQTSDNGYIIAGGTYSFGAGDKDVYLIKTDSLGEVIWVKTYGGGLADWATSVQQTADGGYIICGTTGSFGAGQLDVYVIKIDSLGDTIWTKAYGGMNADGGNYIRQTSDGGYIIVGSTGSYGAGLYDVYLIKTDSSGDTVWTKTYGGVENDGGYCVLQTADRGYIIAAGTYSFGAGREDLWLLKTDTLGDTLWTRLYGGTEGERGYSVCQTSDGGYIIAGYTCSFGSGNFDFYLIRTDSLGDTLWTRTYGGTTSDFSYSVRQTSDQGYVIVGWTGSYGSGGDDVYLIRLGPETDVEEQLSHPGNPLPFLEVLPNPSKGMARILLKPGGDADYVELKIFNVAGELVRSFSPPSPVIVWDGRDDKGRKVSSGVYFIRLNTSNLRITEKMILLR